MVILEAAVCAGVKLYCVILTGVFNTASKMIIKLNQHLSKTDSTKAEHYDLN